VRHSTGFEPVLGIKFNQFDEILKKRLKACRMAHEFLNT
jgi:hypothetical protein